MKYINKKLLYSAFTVVALSGYYSGFAQTKAKIFIDPANMDKTVKPGDDFYTYAGGTWMKNNPVPAKETRWGSFNQLRDFNVNAVKKFWKLRLQIKKQQQVQLQKE